MAVEKRSININFGQGLETKTDPFQLPPGKFLELKNIIFNKGGMLQKRNGYRRRPDLPNPALVLTTFNEDLTAIGDNVMALSEGYQQWVDRGDIKLLNMDDLALVRSNTNQTQADSQVSENGLVCTAYTDQNPGNLAVNIYRYVVADVTTGQNIISPTVLTDADPVFGAPRVFLLGSYFIIVYTRLIAAARHLSWIAVSTTTPTVATLPADFDSAYLPATTQAFDGVVYNNMLFMAWNSTDAIRMASLSSTLISSASIPVDAAHHATLVSVTVDLSTTHIRVSYYDLATTNGYSLIRNTGLQLYLAPYLITSGATLVNLASSAQNGLLTVFYEQQNVYSYAPIPSNLILNNVSNEIGTLIGGTNITARSVGLASKSFIWDGVIYLMAAYKSPFQNTYFLMDSTGKIIAKVAYSNGQGYLTHGLPSFSILGDNVYVPYILKILVQAVNKNTNIPAGSQTDGVYSQLGVNLITFDFTADQISTAEIANNLNINGGITWAYDGYSVTEQGFHLYPDSVVVTQAAPAGVLAGTYFYRVTYEWTDNQGNAFRSAPSIPVPTLGLVLAAPATVTINVPTLRLTYKTLVGINSPVKICVYRYSVAQPIYYQVTSITVPVLNNTFVDSLAITDSLTDAQILGNNVLYTTGGVLENIGPPSFENIFIFDDRLWGITSEDRNLLWFSKQVLQTTPVEFTDLQTIYVAPNIGSEGNTGDLNCGAAMDDKLILFKNSAINYIAGSGPDATGANNQYTQPIFVTSTVGCSNQVSIVFQPQGLMFEFQSKVGNQIWLLGRDLNTQFIGAPVQELTKNATVKAAVNIPGTNQVRFTMSNGITLMWDYFYGQWATFENVPAISSCVYQGGEAFINDLEQVFQETPQVYLDGSQPVLMSFITSWYNLAGLSGYQRIHYIYLTGVYYTPHKINLRIAYDYNPNATQYTQIAPTNFAPTYGQDLTYGSGDPYGGPTKLEQWRIFMERQRCESFQIGMSETFDPRYGVGAGAGFTLSGLNLVIGVKKGHYAVRADQSVG